MAIKTKDEIMNQLKELLKDNTEDSTLSLLEDVDDTLTAGSDSTDWQKKFKESEAEWQKKVDDKDKEWQKKVDDKDKEWRTKYQQRFFSSNNKEDEKEKEKDKEAEAKDRAETIGIDDLFTESKGE
jgi:5-methylcytosine-specific restriction endonuclease McrBC GTP-binding regulatory subunit McrB